MSEKDPVALLPKDRIDSSDMLLIPQLVLEIPEDSEIEETKIDIALGFLQNHFRVSHGSDLELEALSLLAALSRLKQEARTGSLEAPDHIKAAIDTITPWDLRDVAYSKADSGLAAWGSQNTIHIEDAEFWQRATDVAREAAALAV